MERYTTLRLVKSEDLNHHQTLFAGRGAEWFVESGFIAASSVLKPDSIVCVKVHGMHFQSPVRSGETIRFTSMLAHAGRTSLTSHVRVDRPSDGTLILEGFISFVHVDGDTRPVPHGISVTPSDDAERDIQARAETLAGRTRR